MKKILFAINKLGIGGAERLVVDQINALDRNEFEPYLLTLIPEPENSILSEVTLPSEQKLYIPVQGMLDIGSIFKIKKIIKDNNIDIVISNLFLANTIVRIASILAGVRDIFSYEHSIYSDKRMWQRVADKMLARFTKKIFVGAKDVKHFTVKQEGIREDKFVINYNAADFKRLNISKEKNRDTREKFGVPQDAILIVATGRLIEQKGHTYLIKALQKINQDDVYCLIFGQGVLKERLESQIQESGLGERVKLAGIVPMDEILSSADIFCMPSLWEGLSVALVQAMAAGKAIVATNVSGTNEAIVDNENGLLVEPKNSSVLVGALQKLISDAELRERLGSNARSLSVRFSIEENVSRLVKELNN